MVFLRNDWFKSFVLLTKIVEVDGVIFKQLYCQLSRIALINVLVRKRSCLLCKNIRKILLNNKGYQIFGSLKNIHKIENKNDQ